MNQHTKQEIAKFNALANDFWNLEGEFKTLHKINPIRVKFIEEWMDLSNQRVADIGCGGGILAESLDERGGKVIAIDLSDEGIAAAKRHQQKSGSAVDYRVQSTTGLLEEINAGEPLDAVFCMEMLEHVEKPEQIIRECAEMLKPGGLVVFSTINRTKKAYLLAVIVAEYIAGMVPKGTHDPKLFIKPSEMQRMANNVGLESLDIIGFEYRPLSKKFVRSHNVDINYIFAFKKQMGE